MKKILIPVNVITAVLFTFVFIGGCVSSRSGQVYSRHDARQVHMVERGVVESVNWVYLEGTQSPFGILAGAIIGGVLGSTIGSGSGRAVATTLGAVAGGAVGGAVEENSTGRKALEIEVSLDSGETVVIVQEADMDIRPGDRVKILTARDGSARVTR